MTGGDRDDPISTPRLLGLLLPPVGWLLVFLVGPTAVVVAAAASSEGWRVLTSPDTLRLLARSGVVAFAVTAGCLLLGYPVAWFIAGCGPRWRRALLLLVVIPFWSNMLVRAYAVMFLLRPWKLLYTEGAVIGALVQGYLPFMVLPLYVTIEKLPAELVLAARNLGATPFQAFVRVSLPLTLPGVAAGSLLVFVPVLGAFAIPEIVGGTALPMVGSQIEFFFTRGRLPAAGAALTSVLIAATLLLTWIYFRVRRAEGLV